MNKNVEKISDMEADIMRVIWNKGAPTTYTEIRSSLNKKYKVGSQSIQTMIKRLVQKGVLKQEKKEVYYYFALVSEGEYIKSKTMSLVEKVFEGDAKGLLAALVSYEKVTEKDFQELESFWKKGKEENE